MYPPMPGTKRLRFAFLTRNAGTAYVNMNITGSYLVDVQKATKIATKRHGYDITFTGFSNPTH